MALHLLAQHFATLIQRENKVPPQRKHAVLYERSIKKLNEIMFSEDEFKELRNTNSLSLIRLQSNFVARSIYAKCASLLSKWQREYEKIDETFRKKNFMREQFEELQDESQNMEKYIEKEWEYWLGVKRDGAVRVELSNEKSKARKLIGFGKDGTSEDRFKEMKVLDHIKKLDQKFKPLRKTLAEIKANTLMETAVLRSMESLIHKFDNIGWEQNVWEAHSADVLKLCDIVHDADKHFKEFKEKPIMEDMKLAGASYEPNNKDKLLEGMAVARGISGAFSVLNDAIDTFLYSLSKTRVSYGAQDTVRSARQAKLLEAGILEQARRVRQKLFDLYDQMPKSSKQHLNYLEGLLLDTISSVLTQNGKQGNGSLLVPMNYDTKDDMDSQAQENKGSTRASLVAEHQRGDKMPGKNGEPDLSVKCDACSTGIMALALLLYPQKNKLPKEMEARSAVLSGRKLVGHVLWKTNIPFVFLVNHGHGKNQKSPNENLNVPSEFHGVTWEKHDNKSSEKKQNVIKIAALESLILTKKAPESCKTRSHVESIWTNVWLNGVLLDPKAKKNVEDRTFEWHKISKVQDSGKRKKSREEKKEEKSESRKKFYKKLKDEGVWTFTEKMSEARIQTAVKHIARVIRRVYKDYAMSMKGFLSVCGLAELRRVYTFLLDFVGDLIEESHPDLSLNFEQSAADFAASGLLHTDSTLGAAGRRVVEGEETSF